MVSLKEILEEDIAAERPKSLAEQSADKLRELILLEKLPPGLPINERDLSESLGVSRTPVRDVIKLLEVDGLAGEQACQNASDAELADIADLQAQMVDFAESDDRLHLFDLDMQFHTAIVAAAHNPPLTETHNLYNSRLWRARFVSSQRRANREQQMQKHQAIVDALLKRDGKGASLALEAHLRNAIKNIKAVRQALETSESDVPKNG